MVVWVFSREEIYKFVFLYEKFWLGYTQDFPPVRPIFLQLFFTVKCQLVENSSKNLCDEKNLQLVLQVRRKNTQNDAVDLVEHYI